MTRIYLRRILNADFKLSAGDLAGLHMETFVFEKRRSQMNTRYELNDTAELVIMSILLNEYSGGLF